jgi:hypothetical protein
VNKIENDSSGVDEKYIKNKNVKGCIVCQNKKISRITDPIIFRAEMELKTLKEHLETQYIYVDLATLSNHVKHVFYEEPPDIKPAPYPLQEREEVNTKSNLELIKESIASCMALERKFAEEGKTDAKEYFDIIAEKRRLIEMKAKIEGEMKGNEIEIKIPEWVKKIEQ